MYSISFLRYNWRLIARVTSDNTATMNDHRSYGQNLPRHFTRQEWNSWQSNIRGDTGGDADNRKTYSTSQRGTLIWGEITWNMTMQRDMSIGSKCHSSIEYRLYT